MSTLPTPFAIALCVATILVGLALTLAGQWSGPWLEVAGFLAGMLLVFPRGGKRKRVRVRVRSRR